MRPIDADAVLDGLTDDLPYKGSVKRVLMQAPTADVVEVRQTRRYIDGLRHYLRLNQDIAIQHKREGRPEAEEYWKGKLAAFAQVEGYIRHEIDRVRSVEE